MELLLLIALILAVVAAAAAALRLESPRHRFSIEQLHWLERAQGRLYTPESELSHTVARSLARMRRAA